MVWFPSCRLELTLKIEGFWLARKISKSRVTTVAIDKMVFKHPVHVGDTVCCYAKHLKTGKTSMTFEISVYCVQDGIHDRKMVTQAIFTYVAINDFGDPISVNR